MKTSGAGKDEKSEIEILQKELSGLGFMIEVYKLRYLAESGIAYDLMGVVFHKKSSECEWAVIFALDFPHALEQSMKEHKAVCSLENCEKVA